MENDIEYFPIKDLNDCHIIFRLKTPEKRQINELKKHLINKKSNIIIGISKNLIDKIIFKHTVYNISNNLEHLNLICNDLQIQCSVAKVVLENKGLIKTM